MLSWKLGRVPEPELMEDPEEVSSYASAAASRHLGAIDDSFIEHLARLLSCAAEDRRPLRALDIGCGPAQIPIKFLKRFTGWHVVAVDRSWSMLGRARQDAQAAGVQDRLQLVAADIHELPLRSSSFDAVMCNSVLHHARSPAALVTEILRLAGNTGAILLRDLRRPARPLLGWHLWRHGRHYTGKMRELFNASVRASYTAGELRKLSVDAGAIQSGARVFVFGGAHIGIERARVFRN